MDINIIRARLEPDWNKVSDSIRSVLGSDIELLNTTNMSILSHSGKQMRPMLALLIARACSGGMVTEASIRYAASSELLHNATLLHDDVADESEQRRGVPTIMSLMGPAVSVLVGDYWLVKAMELILGDADSDTRVIKIFSKTLSDLAEGEMLQLQKAQKGDTDQEDYLRIIYNKTASLFEAACVSAAVSVGAPEQYEKAAKDYAVALGLALQIKDDILEQKITMPLLGAMKNASESEEGRVRGLVSDIVSHPEYRDEIVEFVKSNGGLEYAVRELERYVEYAVKALEVLPDSYEKECLVALAHFTGKRNK